MVSTASHTNRHFVKSHIFEIIYFCFWMIYYIFYLSQLSSACQTWQISKNQIRTLSIGNANYFRNLGKVMLYENKESCLRHSSVGIFFFFFEKRCCCNTSTWTSGIKMNSLYSAFLLNSQFNSLLYSAASRLIYIHRYIYSKKPPGRAPRP